MSPKDFKPGEEVYVSRDSYRSSIRGRIVYRHKDPGKYGVELHGSGKIEEFYADRLQPADTWYARFVKAKMGVAPTANPCMEIPSPDFSFATEANKILEKYKPIGFDVESWKRLSADYLSGGGTLASAKSQTALKEIAQALGFVDEKIRLMDIDGPLKIRDDR